MHEHPRGAKSWTTKPKVFAPCVSRSIKVPPAPVWLVFWFSTIKILKRTKDSSPPQEITCGGILEQDSQQCSSLFQESCISCDSSLSSVCAEYYSMKVQMEQLHHEMKQCEARKKFYAERKAELNIQYMDLQQVYICF